VLEFKGHGLAYLLDFYCAFKVGGCCRLQATRREQMQGQMDGGGGLDFARAVAGWLITPGPLSHKSLLALLAVLAVLAVLALPHAG
jgi:hypothetical protein